MLLELDPLYPSQQRFKVCQHTVSAVAGALALLQPVSASWSAEIPSEVNSALDTFVGYVMLDAWIANQDRHHENWGAIAEALFRLAPTFDHGAALARNLTDSERRERLSTKDQNRSLAAFVMKGRSAFYASDADKKPLSTLDAFLSFAEMSPVATQAWTQRLFAVSSEQIQSILDRVPGNRISDVGRDFTQALLLENQRRLKEAICQ
jgi:hypothetical protein